EGLEAAAPVCLGARGLDGERRDVDAHDLEAVLREVDRVRAGAAADLQRASGRNGPQLDHVDQQRIGRAGVPRQRLSRSVSLVPRRMRHSVSLASITTARNFECPELESLLSCARYNQLAPLTR